MALSNEFNTSYQEEYEVNNCVKFNVSLDKGDRYLLKPLMNGFTSEIQVKDMLQITEEIKFHAIQMLDIGTDAQNNSKMQF